MSSAVLRSEAAAAAGLCRSLDVVPSAPWPNAPKTLPSLARGERLCSAYERFHEVVPHPRLSFEQWVLVVLSVAEGDVWAIDYCTGCQATILVDLLKTSRRLCSACALRERPPSHDAFGEHDTRRSVDRVSCDESVQQDLFLSVTQT
jgi:hypothetical protein